MSHSLKFCRLIRVYTRDLKLKLLFGPNQYLQNNLRAALWCWHNGNTSILQETDFTSYFLQKVLWVIGKSFLAVSTFVKKELFTHWPSTIKHLWINNLKMARNFPKHITGCRKCPSKPHVVGVFESPGLYTHREWLAKSTASTLS